MLEYLHLKTNSLSTFARCVLKRTARRGQFKLFINALRSPQPFSPKFINALDVKRFGLSYIDKETEQHYERYPQKFSTHKNS